LKKHVLKNQNARDSRKFAIFVSESACEGNDQGASEHGFNGPAKKSLRGSDAALASGASVESRGVACWKPGYGTTQRPFLPLGAALKIVQTDTENKGLTSSKAIFMVSECCRQHERLLRKYPVRTPHPVRYARHPLPQRKRGLWSGCFSAGQRTLVHT